MNQATWTALTRKFHTACVRFHIILHDISPACSVGNDWELGLDGAGGHWRATLPLPPLQPSPLGAQRSAAEPSRAQAGDQQWAGPKSRVSQRAAASSGELPRRGEGEGIEIRGGGGGAAPRQCQRHQSPELRQ